jgi:hypothetical protein
MQEQKGTVNSTTRRYVSQQSKGKEREKKGPAKAQSKTNGMERFPQQCKQIQERKERTGGVANIQNAGYSG